MLIVDLYTTDTSPILNWQLTDILLTHFWCYFDRLLIDLSTNTWVTAKHHSTRYRSILRRFWRTLNGVSAGIAAGVSIDSRPRCWLIHRSTVPQKIHDPSLFGVDVFPSMASASMFGISRRTWMIITSLCYFLSCFFYQFWTTIFQGKQKKTVHYFVRPTNNVMVLYRVNKIGGH